MTSITTRVSVILAVVLAALLCATPVAAEQLDRETVVALAAEHFGWGAAEYVANIARCESGYATTARNAGWDRRWGYYDYRGLLQIEQGLWGPVALRLFGSDDLTDPAINLAMGSWLHRQYGWSPWPVCRYR